jgi:plasmid stabilization system protein ParE
MHLIYHPDAEAELTDAARFYEQRVLALGSRFLDDVDQAIGVILNAPERWRIIEADVRRYLMPRFPYGIYYRVCSDQVRILAFKHHSRHPAYWRYRLPEAEAAGE